MPLSIRTFSAFSYHNSKESPGKFPFHTSTSPFTCKTDFHLSAETGITPVINKSFLHCLVMTLPTLLPILGSKTGNKMNAAHTNGQRKRPVKATSTGRITENYLLHFFLRQYSMTPIKTTPAASALTAHNPMLLPSLVCGKFTLSSAHTSNPQLTSPSVY